MPDALADHLAEFRESWAERAGDASHKRTPDNLGCLALGLEQFLQFSTESGAVSERQAGELWHRAMNAFDVAAGEQERHQQASDPTETFLKLLRAVLSSGAAHVAARDGRPPKQATEYGWREETTASGYDWRSCGPRIGWVEEGDLLLQPEAAFAAIQRMGKDTGEPIHVSLEMLIRLLKQRRILISSDDDRNLKSIKIDGSKTRVLHISYGGGV
jgi:hypothetical protein